MTNGQAVLTNEMIADLGDFHLVFELFVHEDLSTTSIDTGVCHYSFLSAGHFVIVDQLDDSWRKAVSQLLGLFVVEVLLQLDISEQLVKGRR